MEEKGIRALLFRERTMKPTHSEVIVDLLGKAIGHYRSFRSPRAEQNLTVNMAEELVSSQRCSEALDLLRPIVSQYRKDGWDVLLRACLNLALKCAYLVAASSDYVAFCIELASCPPASASSFEADKEEQVRVMSNLCRILDSPPKIPSAEPGM